MKIKCHKYNYALDKSSQNQTFFNSTLQLSKDEKNLIITNKILINDQVKDEEEISKPNMKKSPSVKMG